MKCKIELNMNNLAFAFHPDESLRDVLSSVSDKIHAGHIHAENGESYPIMDVNGNKIGTISFTE